jgi:hypothetical protein
MRANKRKSLDSAAVTKAWEKVFEGMAVDDLDAYLAQGWMTPHEFSASAGCSLDSARAKLKRMSDSGELQRKKVRIKIGAWTRETHIYRPQT